MKNKKSGASLIYVLITLSIITVFSVEFTYFVHQRNKILNIKKDY